MFKWIHLALFSLLPLVCGVFLFSGETDKRIRTSLLSALKRSYLKKPPLIRKVPAVCTKLESKADFSGQKLESDPFNFDLQQKLFSEFLDFRAISRLSQVDSDFRDSLKRAVNQRLVAFHPHFATEDSLVNNLLYSVLNEHFRYIENTNDPLIHDHLQLLCAKYFFDDLNFSIIPSNIYYYIICFMFEMIYETDLKTPATKREFLTHLVCSFRTSNYSLELSYNYVLSHHFIDDSDYSVEYYYYYNEFYDFNDPDHFKFFYLKPSIKDIKTRFQRQDLHIDRFLTLVLDKHALPLFRSIVVLEALLPEFVQPEQILRIYNYFSRYCHYSSELVKRIKSYENAFLQIANFWAHGKYHSVAFQAAKLTRPVIDSSSELVSKINPTNLLESSISNELSFYCLKFISFSQMYSLSKIDACSKLIVSKISYLDDSSHSFILDCLNFLVPAPIELFIKEAEIPVSETAVQKIFYRSKKYASFMRIFLGLMRTDDPFIFLFFPLRALKKVKCLIQDKFDLNLHYRLKDRTIIGLMLCFCMIDVTFGSFAFKSNVIGFTMHRNCSFSFKEAINSFKNDELKRIFSSHPEEFDDSSTISFNQPIERLSSAFGNIEIDPIYLNVPSHMTTFDRLKNDILSGRFNDSMNLIGTFFLTCNFICSLLFDQFNVIYFVALLFILILKFHQCYHIISSLYGSH
jgi:hypothetical protein